MRVVLGIVLVSIYACHAYRIWQSMPKNVQGRWRVVSGTARFEKLNVDVLIIGETTMQQFDSEGELIYEGVLRSRRDSIADGDILEYFIGEHAQAFVYFVQRDTLRLLNTRPRDFGSTERFIEQEPVVFVRIARPY